MSDEMGVIEHLEIRYTDKDETALGIAIAKQTPKSPLLVTVDGAPYWSCPTCDRLMEPWWKYCAHCGQCIAWPSGEFSQTKTRRTNKWR